MRTLVINSLLEDCAKNQCEFNQHLCLDCAPFDYLGHVPMDADGFPNVKAMTRDFFETFSDEKLLAMFDANACLRYR